MIGQELTSPAACRALRRARPGLGTLVEIDVSGLPEKDALTVLDAAFRTIAKVERQMSFHDPQSTLSRLNREAATRPVDVDPWTYSVLETAAEMFAVSAGIFDVTVAGRLQKLGFLPPGKSSATEKRAQSPQANSSERAQTFADVKLLPDFRVRFHHPALKIDLGGIAKGFAVDQALEVLRAAGASRGLVNAGGDLRVFGSAPFPIKIRDPRAPGRSLVTVSLQDAALATSAHYFADRLAARENFGPIFHPQSGARASRVSSASVRAATAIRADALTKIVMLLGAEAAPILNRFSAEAYFVASDGTAQMTQNWHASF